MSKKIQVVVPDRMFDVIEMVIVDDHFNNASDMIRECIRLYLNRRPEIAAMEAKIRELLYGLPLDEQIIELDKMLKELNERQREEVLNGDKYGRI